MGSLKDFCDGRFMANFNELPELGAADLPALPSIGDRAGIKKILTMAMRCGGCGAKVGASILTRARHAPRVGEFQAMLRFRCCAGRCLRASP